MTALEFYRVLLANSDKHFGAKTVWRTDRIFITEFFFQKDSDGKILVIVAIFWGVIFFDFKFRVLSVVEFLSIVSFTVWFIVLQCVQFSLHHIEKSRPPYNFWQFNIDTAKDYLTNLKSGIY